MNNSYICPHCGAFAGITHSEYYLMPSQQNAYKVQEQKTVNLSMVNGTTRRDDYDTLIISACNACKKVHIYLNESVIYPTYSVLPNPADDMPANVKEIYHEARNIFDISPKAGAALLRLGLQLLCKELGGKGKNINDDIKFLVEKGMPQFIQKALDAVRVFGNNSVHPGQIDIDEDKDMASSLFEIMNFIVEDMITKDEKINKIYDKLPPQILEAIETRDSGK